MLAAFKLQRKQVVGLIKGIKCPVLHVDLELNL